ncbi:hypothetical protein [Spirosoma pomorum]
MKRRDFLKNTGLVAAITLLPAAATMAAPKTYTFEELFDNTTLATNTRWHFLKESPLREGILGGLERQGRLRQDCRGHHYYFHGTYPVSNYGSYPYDKQRNYCIPIKATYSEAELKAIAADVLEVLDSYEFVLKFGTQDAVAFFAKEPGYLHLNFTITFKNTSFPVCQNYASPTRK